MLMQNKILAIHTSNIDIVVGYLAIVIEFRDQLDTIWIEVEDKGLVSIALNELASYWKPFVQGVCAHEKLPS
jgi:hypothetical protein